MNTDPRSVAAVVFVLVALAAVGACACTSILVTKGASQDGSVMITYSCDGEFHPHLEHFAAADHQPGDSLDIKDWHGAVRGKVAQVAHTYAVVDLMNEHQLAIGETTTTGREELRNPEGLLDYWDLMALALQRAKTAREAIDVMTGLVDEYGYRSTGESFSIADPQEAWIMEMIGPGEGGKGAIWVALRIPDGFISSYANESRIGEFPLHDPRNCLYSDNVISFAVEKGSYDPAGDKPFRFCDAYGPATIQSLRYCSTRVWSIFRRAAPSKEFSSDYHRGVAGAEPYPLWIRPDAKLSLADVMGLMRDHYEGTPYDMTKGIDAGPFGNPARWRPIEWSVDSVKYAWERSISTQQTGFSMVAQCRSWLPDAVGGVLWYGVDDTYTTCYTPLYCSLDGLPPAYTRGSLQEFSWDSAWWIFNLVANYAWLKYSYMVPEIVAVQREIEGKFMSLQPSVEKTALDLSRNDPDMLRQYLTDYSVSQAEMVVKRWQDLAGHLITKCNDGYVKDEDGRPKEVGYPEAWLREVLRTNPHGFELGPAGQVPD
jgi:dipeptidase